MEFQYAYDAAAFAAGAPMTGVLTLMNGAGAWIAVTSNDDKVRR